MEYPHSVGRFAQSAKTREMSKTQLHDDAHLQPQI
jgi:hypothetical protein